MALGALSFARMPSSILQTRQVPDVIFARAPSTTRFAGSKKILAIEHEANLLDSLLKVSGGAR